jgi:hypothetical protein
LARTWGRKGRPWSRVQARVYREETHCAICGGYVDQTIPNPRDKWARSVHHLVPPDIDRNRANDRELLRLAHYGCNASYGRGQYKGQGSNPGRSPRGTQRRAYVSRYPRARVRESVGAVAADRDW